MPEKEDVLYNPEIYERLNKDRNCLVTAIRFCPHRKFIKFFDSILVEGSIATGQIKISLKAYSWKKVSEKVFSQLFEQPAENILGMFSECPMCSQFFIKRYQRLDIYWKVFEDLENQIFQNDRC